MREIRRRGWIIDAFLWVCPLAGIGGFIAGLLAGKAPPRANALPGTQFFDVPGAGGMALLACSTLVPLIVACATRRLSGFFAGVSFLLLLMSGAAWLRGYWASDRDDLWQLEKGAAGPTLNRWTLVSHGGGMALFHTIWMNGPGPQYFQSLLSPGREGHLFFWSGTPVFHTPAQRDPAGGFGFGSTSKWLQRLGFAVESKPAGYWTPQTGGVAFAFALPYWLIFLLAVPLPLTWGLRWRRRRHVVIGACAVCGYDLRATPDPAGARLAICPECGAACKAANPAGLSPAAGN